MKTPVAILIRVSTQVQETERQRTELIAHASQNGWDVVEVIEEHAVQGSSLNRPGLDRALHLASTHKIKKLLVHEVSRVARTNSIAHKFIEDLISYEVSLYWHAQNVETLLQNGKRNPAASIMFALLSEMARAERETLIERTRSGLDAARRRGVTLGRPKGSSLPTHEFLEKHSDAVKLLRSGHSIRHVAAITRKAKSTVERIKKELEPRVSGSESELVLIDPDDI